MADTIKDTLLDYTRANNNRVSKFYTKLKNGALTKSDELTSQEELDRSFRYALAEIKRIIEKVKPDVENDDAGAKWAVAEYHTNLMKALGE